MILVYGPIDRQCKRLQRRGVLAHPRDRPIKWLASVTAVVLATKFCTHSEQDTLIRLYGRDRVHLVWGGDSKLREKIRELLTKKGE